MFYIAKYAFEIYFFRNLTVHTRNFSFERNKLIYISQLISKLISSVKGAWDSNVPLWPYTSIYRLDSGEVDIRTRQNTGNKRANLTVVREMYDKTVTNKNVLFLASRSQPARSVADTQPSINNQYLQPLQPSCLYQPPTRDPCTLHSTEKLWRSEMQATQHHSLSAKKMDVGGTFFPRKCGKILIGEIWRFAFKSQVCRWRDLNEIWRLNFERSRRFPFLRF